MSGSGKLGGAALVLLLAGSMAVMEGGGALALGRVVNPVMQVEKTVVGEADKEAQGGPEFVPVTLFPTIKPSTRSVVTYWEKWTGFEGDAMRAVAEAFNASQDKYEVRILTVSNIPTKVTLATAGGIPPDVAGLFGPNITQYSMQNLVMPLDELIKRDGIKESDYVPSYWDMLNVDGKIWAMPSTPASTALHINKKHFREAGLDPENPPKTIEELDEVAKKMTSGSRQEGYKRLGFIPAEPGWWRDRFGYLFGAKMWDPATGKVTADSPENVRAYTWTQSYSTNYGRQAITDFQGGFGSFSSPQNAYLDGKVSMVLQGVWMHNFIRQFTKDFEWAAVPFPYPADQPQLANQTYVDMDILVIPRGAKNVEGAWAFIKYVQSQEGMELLCLGQRKHSPLTNVSQEFWDKHENPYVRLFYDLAKSPNAMAPPKIGIWPEYSGEMNNAFDRINNGADVKEVLAAVTKRMQPRLDKELFLRRKRLEAGQP